MRRWTDDRSLKLIQTKYKERKKSLEINEFPWWCVFRLENHERFSFVRVMNKNAVCLSGIEKKMRNERGGSDREKGT